MRVREFMLRVRQCHTMCLAGQAAATFYHAACLSDAGLLPDDKPFRVRDIERCGGDLGHAYLVRMFAEYEGALREFWQAGMGRHTHPMASVLMDRVASRCRMPGEVLQHAHEVREYRNSLIHGGVTQPLTLDQSRTNLCRYLSFLPLEW